VKRWRRAFCCVGVLVVSGSSQAARSEGTVPASELARCAALVASDDRLACFDRLAAAVAGAPRESAASSQAGAKSFGLPAPVVRSAPEETSVIEGHITRLIDNRAGRALIVLDNGQTWTLTDAIDYSRLSSGDAVTIRRAALGSFIMATPSRHSFHVRRLR
jgi:hypothetical protein